MINVSNAFKQLLYEDKRNWLEYVDITLADGTELHLTNADLWQGGMSIEDSVSGNDSFDVGAAIINQCTLAIENLDERFSEYDFGNAKVVPKIGLQLPDGSTETIQKGVFTVDETQYNGSIITLSCLDNMAKFDRPYSESSLAYPATLNEIVRDACERCNVQLQTYEIPHGDFSVQAKPSEESTTFREVVAWAAQIAGCFARCDTHGRLELKWYDQKLLEKTGLDGGIFDPGTPKYESGDSADGGSFKPWDTGDTYDGGTFKEMENVHHIYSHYSSPVLSTDDVVITGVKVLEKTQNEENQDAIATYSTGGEGYWIIVQDNALIQGGNGLQICTWLGQQLIGFRFRKATLNHASDPTMEAGDIGIITDRKQRNYPIIVSYTKFSTGGSQTTESRAQNPIKNSAARFSASTKNYVDFRKDIQQERTETQKALDALGERIDSSSGLYTTEAIQADRSRIFYMHNKPSLDESDIVWKMTAEAWGVSTDGGKTYNAGMTVDGNTIVRILSAVGINADWVNAGTLLANYIKGGVLTIGGVNNEDGIIEAKAADNSTICTIGFNGLNLYKGTVTGTKFITIDPTKHYPDPTQIIIDDSSVQFYEGQYTGGNVTSSYAGEIKPDPHWGCSYWNDDEDQIIDEVAGWFPGLLLDAQYVLSISAGGTRHLDFDANGANFLTNLIASNGMYASSADVGGTITANTGKYQNLYVQNLPVYGDITITSLGASGKQVTTKALSYEYSLLSPMKGDIGSGETDENGLCYVYLDDYANSAMNTSVEYYVFLQKEGPGDIWIKEKNEQYFIVEGTPNLKFSWELKGKQTGYEYERLENADPLETTYEDPEMDLINEAATESSSSVFYNDQEQIKEIKQAIKEREEALYQ